MAHDIARYVRHLSSTLQIASCKKKIMIFMQIQNNAKRKKAWGGDVHTDG
jgi:hypothetical protein